MSELPATPQTGGPGRSALGLLAVLLVCGALAWFARDVNGLRRPNHRFAEPELERLDSGARGWFSVEPDGHYHTRRVERALQAGQPPAGTDPYLNYPHGARIPWPPYYDALMAMAIGPFAPEGETDATYTERRAFIERSVATFPAWFGVGAVLLAAASAFRLTRGTALAARLAGALVAGATLALCFAAVNYTVVGNGDHHGWIALLHAGLLLISACAFCRGNLSSPRRSAVFGVAAGLVAGVMLGSWVASLLYIINLQLALAWLLFRRSRDELPGVAALGLSFHLTAAAVILPAVLASPWRDEFPWMVVNLSWFHPAQLLVGALIFVPILPGLGGGRGGDSGARFATGSAGARRYPWLVGLALILGAGLLRLIGSGPYHGIAEGFAWVSRADAFMATVFESTPLIGPRSPGPSYIFDFLGYGILLLPIAWLLLAFAAFRRRLDVLVPFAVAVPPLLAQALNQLRFGDVFAFPMAVCLGWLATRTAAALSKRLNRVPTAVWPALALALALVLQWPMLNRTRNLRGSEIDRTASYDHMLGDRLAYEWIRTQYPAPDRDPKAPWAVLAHWDRGHSIEWAADRPTVATNFGSYVGEDSYRDPARFLLAEDPLQGRALLMQRSVRHVFIPGSLPGDVGRLVRVADVGLAQKYLTLKDGREVHSGRWLSTLGARLLNGGIQRAPAETPLEQLGSPLGYLRLAYVCPIPMPMYMIPDGPNAGAPMPANFVWEHVPGATIAARGAPNDLVRADLAVRYREANYKLELTFVARCDESGVARLWIPYTTEGPNGEGEVDSASWTITTDTGANQPSAQRSGALVIPERAVFGGRPIQIP